MNCDLATSKAFYGMRGKGIVMYCYDFKDNSNSIGMDTLSENIQYPPYSPLESFQPQDPFLTKKKKIKRVNAQMKKVSRS